MKPSKIVLSLFIAYATGLLAVQTAWSQTEKLGIIRYTPPKGWTKTRKPNVVAFSKFDQAKNKYCILTVYGATPGAGSPQKDFAREWNKLVVEPLAAEADPKTDVQKDAGWTATPAGAAVESEVGKAAGFLTVISILAVFNDTSYAKQVGAFIDAIEMDKIAAPPKPAAKPVIQDGHLIIPIVTRQLTLADLAGKWGENSGISTTYVDRSTGAYAGTDSLHYTNKMTITRKGGYKNEYFGIRNGRKESDDTIGTIAIAGRVISTKRRVTANRTTTTRFVVVGWLELPDMTLMTVSSNYFPGDVIPENVLKRTDPRNYSTTWVRKK